MSSLTTPSTFEVLQAHGIDRRAFLRFCTMTAAAMGLPYSGFSQVMDAMRNKPCVPVLWLHDLECTCCSESFIRSAHPIAQDLLFNMISLDYDDTLQAAAGERVEEIRRKIIEEHPGEYLLAVEGNAPPFSKRFQIRMSASRRLAVLSVRLSPRLCRLWSCLGSLRGARGGGGEAEEAGRQARDRLATRMNNLGGPA